MGRRNERPGRPLWVRTFVRPLVILVLGAGVAVAAWIVLMAEPATPGMPTAEQLTRHDREALDRVLRDERPAADTRQ